MASPTFFEPHADAGATDGGFTATERTAGPWSPELMHAGPPSALLVRAMEALAPREGAQVARVVVDLLGPLHRGEVDVTAEVLRPGRAVELLQAELVVDGRAAMRAQAWRIADATVAAGASDEATPELPEEPDALPPSIGGSDAYINAVEWRSTAGTWHEPGPATVWARPRIPLVPDDAMSPLQRLLCVCDSASGVSAALPWDGFMFINTDLTVHLARPPRGEWACLDAVTRIPEGGVGLCTARLGDADGWLGRSAQSLLVRER